MATDALYWDSSALIKRYVKETSSEHVQAVFESRNTQQHVTSVITHAEMLAAFKRIHNNGFITTQALEGLIGSFINDWHRMVSINYSSHFQSETLRLLRSVNVRGADLIHIATVKALAIDIPNLRFASFDLRLNNACKDLGVNLLW